MSQISPTLNVPQAKFLAMPQKFKSFVAGFGSGKTWVGCSDLAKHFYEHPRINAGYFAPTYTQIRDIFYPTIDEAIYDWGLNAVVRMGNKEVDIYRGRKNLGTILCRSMDDPGTIVGFKIGKALIDEIDIMPQQKAQYVWRKILARMRYNVPGLVNGVDVTTTPEGFRFVYNQFVKQIRDNPELSKRYGIIQASTRDNAANLPEDYIDSLVESYTPELIEAYIDGQFTNLRTGTIYKDFKRKLNTCSDTIQDDDTVIYLGMDFNVGKMASVAHVKRNNQPRAVDEIINAYDTPDMIKRIKERYWKFNGRDYERTRQIRIYPDSSGDSRKTVNASETDIALLRQAGFVVCAPASNPPVKDRINAMNGMFYNAAGERRYLVNLDKCPSYAEALEQQAYADNGEPDKSTGHDHVNDAAGYFIMYEYPVVKRIFAAQQPTGGRRS